MTARSSWEPWPALPLEAWAETCATLHRWTQIVGKIRLTQGPWCNHSWHVTLYVTARGLTTSPMPHGDRTFQIDFDFIDHQVSVAASDGRQGQLALEPMSVATFHARLMALLQQLDLPVAIHPRPNEVVDPIPFAEDETHAAYDRDYANRYWRALTQADRVFKTFRADFLGKCSPVHYFWGAPDLAVTRFSGRRAPLHPGGIPNLPDAITREAYSEEVCSCGFWPGGDALPYPAFYAYAYPEPNGLAEARIAPADAFYSKDMREFVLPYDVVRQAAEPDAVLLAFLRSTYVAAADLGKWDRAALDVPRE